MKLLLKNISQKALLLKDFKFSANQQKSGWLGNVPSSTKDISDLEQKLNLELPTDYKHLLELSNGFAAPSFTEPQFLSIAEVDFLKNINSELIEIWSETGNGEIAKELERSICIAGKNEEQQFLLIPPNVSNADWQYWKFAHWIPGKEVYENLTTYFQSVLDFISKELDG